jgi:hypothetical protein
MRPTCQVRSNQWSSSVVASSAATFSITTDDPSLSVMSAPMPALMLGLKGNSAIPFNLTQAAPPPAPVWRAPPPIPPVPAPEPPVEAAPAIDQPEPEPPQEAAEATSEAEAEAVAELKNNAHAIELIIDSLPNHTLIEPIPITIESLGEKVFTASVRNLDISTTGNSIGEALLVLKGQIETIYRDLSKKNQTLDAHQKTMLQMLHTYIAPLLPPRRPEWH